MTDSEPPVAPGPLHPQVQALVEGVGVEARLADGPSKLSDLRLAYAQTAERLGGTTVPVEDVVDTHAADVPVRVYTPPRESAADHLGAIVYCHGGGWVTGDLDGIDRVCRSLCLLSGQLVCSVDYRLAPEHRFPAAVDDALSALRWIASPQAAGRFGHDHTRVAVAGDSAGANLVAVASLHEPQLVAAQLLIYPAVDATQSSASYAEFTEGYALSRGDMAFAFEEYLGAADREDPDVSPLFSANLAAAPPAFIAVASHDVLRDDGVRYAERLRENGVVVELEVMEGLVHGFIRWGGVVAAANTVLETGGAFLADHLTR